MRIFRPLFFSLLWLLATFAQAETLYVINELKIGLHKEASIDSPIIKLLPSGTALSVITRINDLVNVRDPQGANGWINSKYLIANKPGDANVQELQKEIALLKSAAAKAQTTNNIPASQKDLVQQLKSERLKSGQLEASLADIKAKIAKVDNTEEFLSGMDDLKQENEQLRSQLEASGIEVNSSITSNNSATSSWKDYSITFFLILIIGMAIGAFILDYLSRRRHGGFRI